MASRSGGHVRIADKPYVLAQAGPVDPSTGGLRPAYDENLVQYPARRQAEGGQGYEDWPVQIESPQVIRSLENGFGQRIWSANSAKYWYGFVDTRIPQQVTLPPLLHSQSITAEDRLRDDFVRTISSTKNQFACMGRYVKTWTDPTAITTSKDFGTGIVATSAATFQGVTALNYTFVATQVTTGGMPQPYWTFTAASATTTWAADQSDDTVPPAVAIYDDNGVFFGDFVGPFELDLSSLVAADDAVYLRSLQPFEGFKIAISSTNPLATILSDNGILTEVPASPFAVTLNSFVAAEDALYIRLEGVTTGIRLDVDNTNGNASIMTASYWNGTAWTTLGDLSDGTASGGNSVAQDGDVVWTTPEDWDTNFINGTEGIHVRLTWSANLDASTSLTTVVATTGSANDNASVLTVKYWNGTSYVDLSATDGTITSGKSLAKGGNVTWTLPTAWVPNEVTGNDSNGISVGGNGFHVQLTWSLALDADVKIADIDLIQRDTAVFFETHGGKIWRIAKQSDGFVLFSTDDGGNNATWTEIGVITDLGNPITAMNSIGTRLFINSEQTLFALSGDGVDIAEEVWPHPRKLSDEFNGVGSSMWRGSLFTPARFGLYSVFDTEGFIIISTDISPGNLLQNDSPVNGRITCFAGDDYFGYAIMQDPDGVSYLISYNPLNSSWHSLLNLGSITARHMWVSDVGHSTNGLLYFSDGTNLRYIILQRNGPNPLRDSAYRYDNATTDVGKLFLSQFKGIYDFEEKAWLTGKGRYKGVTATETITYSYRTAESGGYTDLVVFTSGTHGASTFNSSVASKFIEERVTLATGSPASTPNLIVKYVSFVVKFPFKRIFQMALRVNGGMVLPGGGTDRRSSARIKADLITVASSSTPIVLEIIDSAETLDVIPIGYRLFLQELVDADGDKQAEYVVFMEFVEHAATIFGTHEILGGFTHGDLAGFTHTQLTGLPA